MTAIYQLLMSQAVTSDAEIIFLKVIDFMLQQSKQPNIKEEKFMFWNPELLAKIDAADDLKIAPYHPDMNTTGTPTWIWEVTVDNRLFVRAYSGTSSKWYQAALSQQAGKILAIGQEFDVLFAKPSDSALENKIDQAYRIKYSSSSYVSAMTGTRARAATVEILPS